MYKYIHICIQICIEIYMNIYVCIYVYTLHIQTRCRQGACKEYMKTPQVLWTRLGAVENQQLCSVCQRRGVIAFGYVAKTSPSHLRARDSFSNYAPSHFQSVACGPRHRCTVSVVWSYGLAVRFWPGMHIQSAFLRVMALSMCCRISLPSFSQPEHYCTRHCARSQSTGASCTLFLACLYCARDMYKRCCLGHFLPGIATRHCKPGTLSLVSRWTPMSEVALYMVSCLCSRGIAPSMLGSFPSCAATGWLLISDHGRKCHLCYFVCGAEVLYFFIVASDAQWRSVVVFLS